MRIRLIGGSVAIALVALLSSAAPSQAYIPQPWCSDLIETAAGAPVCMYRSYEQCVENTISRGGCMANPAIGSRAHEKHITRGPGRLKPIAA